MSSSLPVRDEAEIVVVGGGPSGSTTAAVLAEAGHDVLIVDKDCFPRPKPCGDGLLPPAVAAAERLGLGGLIEGSREIEAARVVLSHRRQSVTEFRPAAERPRPRCITRSAFDAALVEAAQLRGARLARGRVDGVEQLDGGHRLIAEEDGERFWLRAGTVVAADGATSRIRRTVVAGYAKPLAYAVRQYFVTEKPLDPVFDCYIPLEFEGMVLSGYGWVFPVDEHTANIGLGFYRDGLRSTPPLTKALRAFIEELEMKARHRFGSLQPLGSPYGSPLGIRTRIESSEVPGVYLSGDAAGTTHALTGEGIAFAMRSGNLVAEEVRVQLRRKGGRARQDGVVSRPFPQLGIDVSMLSRAWSVEMTKGAGGSAGTAPKPFLGTVKRMMGESAYETEARGTPAWEALAAHGDDLSDGLERANRALLGTLSNQFPFVSEVIHRTVRKHLGPMYAAIVLAIAGADGAPLTDPALDAGVAAESVGALPELLTMMIDRTPTKALKVNNAFAILTADFAAARALSATAKLGADAVSAFALACQQGCQGGMRDSAARFAADRSVDDWVHAARETTGSAVKFAIQLGLKLRGRDLTLSPSLERYATEAGLAIRLAEEIVDLAVDDPGGYAQTGMDLRRGTYPLVLLYAIEADRGLPTLLARQNVEDRDPDEVAVAVRECGALDRAVAECAKRSELAATLAVTEPLGGEVLSSLAVVPAGYLSSRVRCENGAP